MLNGERSRARKRLKIGSWTSDQSPEEVADRARYLGSGEHKSYPSAAGPPALRFGNTPCDPKIPMEQIRETLRQGFRRRCIGRDFEHGFPKYVWGWIGKTLYLGRHINGPAGAYKGFEVDLADYPDDPEGRLDWSSE